jgi:hypothetical protein
MRISDTFSQTRNPGYASMYIKPLYSYSHVKKIHPVHTTQVSNQMQTHLLDEVKRMVDGTSINRKNWNRGMIVDILV